MKIFLIIIVVSIGVSSLYSQNQNDSLLKINVFDDLENNIFPLFERLDGSNEPSKIPERMNFFNTLGLSIAVISNGKIYSKGYGVANTLNGTLVNDSTLFQAASVSKPITALGILLLFEKGLIGLDVDVNTYLKSWKIPDNKFTSVEKVTLRRLLSHTAGINSPGFYGYKQTDTLPSINMILDGKGNSSAVIVDTIPGSVKRYSNGGYLIIQKVFEDITGLDFADYIKQNVFIPLEMTNSSFVNSLPKEFYINASATYDYNGDIVDGLWHNNPELAVGGLTTTPTDLAKYCLEILEILDGKKNGILSQKTVGMMLNEGLGMRFHFSGDSLIFGHSGRNIHFNTQMSTLPNKRVGYVIMSNSEYGYVVNEEIKNAISDFYDLGNNVPCVKEIKLDEKVLQQYIGEYTSVKYKKQKVKISQNGNGLKLEFTWRTSELIWPIDEGIFYHPNADGQTKFYKTEDGQFMDYYGLYQCKKIE